MAHSRKNDIFTAIIAMLPIWVLAIVTSLAFSDCSGDGNANMPRRKAFPRIATHDSTFMPLASSPLHFEISTVAKVTLDSINTGKATGENNRWFNVSYDDYNAVIYCTFTPVDSTTINNVIANRTERMALNVGGNTSELTELTNANGFTSRILSSLESSVTPVQFLSTDGNDWVVTGALHFTDVTTADIDSLKPIIDVVKRDIIHSLKTIKK